MKSSSLLDENGFVQANNSVILSGKSLQIREELFSKFKSVFSDYDNVIVTPALVDVLSLEKANYPKNFPENIYKGINHSVSACHHIYGLIENKKISGNKFIVSGQCIRKENNKHVFPFRLESFEMLEYVELTNEKNVDSLHKSLIEKGAAFFNSIQIPTKIKLATDSFYSQGGESQKAYQLLKKLKYEFVCKIDGQEVALGSLNKHEGFFCNQFNLNCSESLCFAIGVERCIAGILLND